MEINKENISLNNKEQSINKKLFFYTSYPSNKIEELNLNNPKYVNEYQEEIFNELKNLEFSKKFKSLYGKSK